MICSASDFSSSGLSGAVLRATSSPFTRIVAGRPTLSSRSDALRWTICVIACLKLNVGALAEGASAMWIHSEENLPELDRLRVLDPHLAHHPGDLGLDFVHDLHRFDDAHHLPRGDAAPHLDVRRGAGLGGGIERPHHGGLDLEQLADRGGREGGPLPRGREGRRGGGRGLGDDDVAPPRVRRMPGLRYPHGRPGPEQPPANLDRAQLRSVPQDLHQLRDDERFIGANRLPGEGVRQSSSTSSLRPSESSTGPCAARCTSSSIRTPPWPARYTPGSMVTTAPTGSGSAFVFASRGASCTSSPMPWPSEWPNASPNPRAAITSRASASASRPAMPARTPARARRCASSTSAYSVRCCSVARAPTTTVRVMSAQ